MKKGNQKFGKETQKFGATYHNLARLQQLIWTDCSNLNNNNNNSRMMHTLEEFATKMRERSCLQS